MRRCLPLSILLPLVISACGGGGGDDDQGPANPFSFSGTRSGTADFGQDNVPSTILQDLPVSGTISRNGSFRFTVVNPNGEIDTLTGTVDENGVVANAVVSVDKPTGTDYSLQGRGSIGIAGAGRIFSLGFRGTDTEDPAGVYDDFQYTGTLN